MKNVNEEVLSTRSKVLVTCMVVVRMWQKTLLENIKLQVRVSDVSPRFDCQGNVEHYSPGEISTTILGFSKTKDQKTETHSSIPTLYNTQGTTYTGFSILVIQLT